MSPRLPTSQAYWNLRAEQVMDRVFSDGERTLEAVQVQVRDVKTPPPTPASTSTASSKAPEPRQRVPISLLVLTLMGVLGSFSLGLQWWSAQQALQRERNLALIEKLRQRTATTKPSEASTAIENPQEPIPAPPVVQQLEPVTIPIRSLPRPEDPLPTPAEVESAAAAVPVTPEPLLVGVVHSGGGQGSAIFQLGNQSLSAAPGESIGNSGWSLRSVTANGAVIERGGASRSLSVGGAF
ncbi:MAG: hypothetical protein ACPG3W_06025 [Synechococcus sp.]|uniref:hypothetical protein n=1 Tax=Synechococcus sp. BMK-MC-1 TaxID=1442551 RepID=UPI0016473389|nr:hypothetical protein [Synechococcus sp. BMK-MC-1]QNI69024.1 putative conserved membrane protein [Synechococcus sp. BMK-MC-1]